MLVKIRLKFTRDVRDEQRREYVRAVEKLSAVRVSNSFSFTIEETRLREALGLEGLEVEGSTPPPLERSKRTRS